MEEVFSSLGWGSGGPVMIGLIDDDSLSKLDVVDRDCVSVYISPEEYNICQDKR